MENKEGGFYLQKLFSREFGFMQVNIATNLVIFYLVFKLYVLEEWDLYLVSEYKERSLSVLALIGLIVMFIHYYKNMNGVIVSYCDYLKIKKKISDGFYDYSFTEKYEIKRNISMWYVVPLALVGLIFFFNSFCSVVFGPWVSFCHAERVSFYAVFLTYIGSVPIYGLSRVFYTALTKSE